MTSIVAILNKNGVAIAADRAGSIELNGAQKTYDNSKIFRISNQNFVCLGTYQSFQFYGIPIEILAKEYRRSIGDSTEDSLFMYVTTFLTYVGNFQVNDNIHNEEYITSFLIGLQRFIKQKIKEATLEGTEDIDSGEDIGVFIESTLQNYFDYLSSIYENEDKNKGFSNEDLDAHISTYSNHINEIIESLFTNSNLVLTSRSIELIIELIKHQYYYNIYGDDYSGLIFTGYGKIDIFPKLKEIRIFTKINGNISFREFNVVDISDTSPWVVVPFAQSDVILNLAKGIDPNIQRSFIEGLNTIISNQGIENTIGESLNSEIVTYLHTLIDNHTSGMQGVTFLPLKELGTTAETLVNLTTFKRRVTIDKETVGGNTDVAIISKCDGLVWFKREHYFKKELNYHFFK